MDTPVHYRYAPIEQLLGQPTVAAENWLSPQEYQTWRKLQSTQRRATWLAGRVLSKQLLTELAGDELNTIQSPFGPEIHIQSRSACGKLGQRPRVMVRGRDLGWALSITHTSRGVLVAAATEPGVLLGVDLVDPADIRSASLEWCLSSAEKRLLAALPRNEQRAERLWAMKEAVFKACRLGEGFAPWKIDVSGGPEEIQAFAVRPTSLQTWRVDGQIAALAVADQASDSMTNVKIRGMSTLAFSS